MSDSNSLPNSRLDASPAANADSGPNMHSERRPDCAATTFVDLASALARQCTQALDGDRVDAIPADALGQLFASVVRLYAAKAQLGATPPPFGRHGAVTATDVAIGCTAMLEGVGLTLFDLGAWQTLASVRPAKISSASPVSAETTHDVKYQAA